MKILVIQLSRFGDLLQTTPMLYVLRHRYPQASITVLSRYNVMEIYKDNPNVDYVELFNIEEYTTRLLEDPKDIFRFYIELRDAVVHLKSMKFDLVVNVTHDRFSTFLAYLLSPPEIKGMYLSPGKRLQVSINGFWFRYLRCTSEFRKNASFNLVDIYKNAAGGHKDALNLFFHTTDNSLAHADNLLDRNNAPGTKDHYIGFQLGTSTGNRRWPSEYFAALGEMLHQDKAIRVVLLGSRGEIDLGEEVAALMELKPINLIGKTDLSGLAAVLRRCSLLVTNDTGTMHMAEAVGTTCVTLFFESANPFQTGPYGAGHIILFPELDCFPCPTTFRCDEKKCLNTISVDTVQKLVEYKLNGNGPQTIHPSEGVRIYETRFSKAGIWDAWPMVNAKLRKNEFIRMAYKAAWLRYDKAMGGTALEESDYETEKIFTDESMAWGRCYSIEKQSIKSWLEESGASFNMLDEHINRGLALMGEIDMLTTSAQCAGAAVTKKSDEIGRVDQEITRLGMCNLWLSQLTSLFELELGQVQDGDFFVMLKAWKGAYENLKTRSSILRQDIPSMIKQLGSD